MKWSPVIEPETQVKIFVWPLVANERGWTKFIEVNLGIKPEWIFKGNTLQPKSWEELKEALEKENTATVVQSQVKGPYSRLLREWPSHIEDLQNAIEEIPGCTLTDEGIFRHPPTKQTWEVRGKLPASYIWEEVLPEIYPWLHRVRPTRDFTSSVRKEAWHKEMISGKFTR